MRRTEIEAVGAAAFKNDDVGVDIADFLLEAVAQGVRRVEGYLCVPSPPGEIGGVVDGRPRRVENCVVDGDDGMRRLLDEIEIGGMETRSWCEADDRRVRKATRDARTN